MAEEQRSSFGAEEQSYFPQLTRRHGKSIRLTPAGEALLNERLVELCAQQTPPLDMARMLNEEFGLSWTLEAYFRRAQRLNLSFPWTSRARARGQISKPSAPCFICGRTDYTPGGSRQKTCGDEECQAALHLQHYHPHPLTPERKREICLDATARRDALRDKTFPRWNGESPDTVKKANPAYENGEAFKIFAPEFVICRVCGKLVQSIAAHLSPKKNVHPGIDLEKYKPLYPGAPIYSPKVKKRISDWQIADNKANPQRRASFRAKRKVRADLAFQKASQADEVFAEKEKELAQAKQVVIDLTTQVKALKKLADGQEGEIATAVNDAIPRFQLLFSRSEIDQNPKLLLSNWQHPDFTWDEMMAARNAYLGRKAKKYWPVLAARWFVALTRKYEIETVRRYHNRHMNSRA